MGDALLEKPLQGPIEFHLAARIDRLLLEQIHYDVLQILSEWFEAIPLVLTSSVIRDDKEETGVRHL